MIDPDVFSSFCRELDVVEETIYCVVDLETLGPSQIRIEALRSVKTEEYQTHVYIKADQQLSLDGQTIPENYGIWVSWTDFPWTSGKTADDAIRSALSFLRERCKPEARTTYLPLPRIRNDDATAANGPNCRQLVPSAPIF